MPNMGKVVPAEALHAINHLPKQILIVILIVILILII